MSPSACCNTGSMTGAAEGPRDDFVRPFCLGDHTVGTTSELRKQERNVRRGLQQVEMRHADKRRVMMAGRATVPAEGEQIGRRSRELSKGWVTSVFTIR